MIDVITLGEILIDFTPSKEKNEQGLPTFTANPGGAPSNVAVALSNLGKRTAFIGAVGNDYFGKMLTSTLSEKDVNTNGMVYVDVHTTMTFVHIEEDGERAFTFHRNPGADTMLTKESLDLNAISQSKICHVGSLSMTNNPARTATRTTLKHAKDNNILISYDPNLRPSLWKNLDKAKTYILEVMSYANIVKVSEDELEFLTNTTNIQNGAKQLMERFELDLLFITLGAKGSYCFNNQFQEAFSKGFSVKAIDTTGCGDAFFAGVLYKILENNLSDMTEEKMKEMLTFGNALGAYVSTKHGGIPGMPTLNQISSFIEKY